ncbi:MAG TPA: NAD(P)H-hydrate dehydratase [Nannocystaceae bacterium]|nr:NAD(P)H-hydrate dehydratase [Nannocystaceae bacterium]
MKRITPRLLRGWPLPELDGRGGKRARGTVVVVGGSTQVPGAVVLAAVAALRAGAGRLQIATARSAAPHVAVSVPEARVVALAVDRKGELARANQRLIAALLDDATTLLLGPGMRDVPLCGALQRSVAARHEQPVVVVDAGALQAVPSGIANLVLTPHAGEAARMLDTTAAAIARHPLAAATRLAQDHRATVVLKGDRTLVVDPEGAAYENVAGNLGLGTSGSGDTLSGVIAGLCARGATPPQAAVWGVHAHAVAGDRLARRIAPLGYLARELLAEIPALVAAWSHRQPTRPARARRVSTSRIG